MATIYVVIGRDYDMADVIKAFYCEKEANNFQQECEKYDKQKRKTKAWEAAHPAKSIYYIFYEVIETELV